MALKDRPGENQGDDNLRRYEVIIPAVQGVELPLHWQLSQENFRRMLNDIIPTAESKDEMVDYARLFDKEELNERLHNIKELMLHMYETMMKREVVWKSLVKRHLTGE